MPCCFTWSYLPRSSWATAGGQWSCPACTRSAVWGGPSSGKYPASRGSCCPGIRCSRCVATACTWSHNVKRLAPPTLKTNTWNSQPTVRLSTNKPARVRCESVEHWNLGGEPAVGPAPCSSHMTRGEPVRSKDGGGKPCDWAEFKICASAARFRREI